MLRDDQHRAWGRSRQVKVLFVVTAFSRSDGDVITPWLVQLIHRLASRGIDVEVLAPSYRGLGTQVVHGVRVHRFRYAPRALETLTHDQTAPDRIREKPAYAALLPGYVALGSLAAIRLARSGGFDAIHAFWPLPHGLLGLAAKRAARLPLISTFFGVELTWVERGMRAARPLLRRIIRESDAVTAISTYTARLVSGLEPTADPVIIPFGAAVEPTAAPPERPRPAGELALLFVGRLVERKGISVLLKALALLGPDGKVTLDVIGGGPERDALERQCEDLGLSGVTFHGFVPAEALQDGLARADALVLPAVTDAKGDVEGLGVVLLEAMSYGKPVIASAAGGITDIVEDGVTGLLVPPGDAASLAAAIARLRDDPALGRRLALAGRERVATHFSWTSVVERLVDLYRSVIERRNAS